MYYGSISKPFDGSFGKVYHDLDLEIEKCIKNLLSYLNIEYTDVFDSLEIIKIKSELNDRSAEIFLNDVGREKGKEIEVVLRVDVLIYFIYLIQVEKLNTGKFIIKTKLNDFRNERRSFLKEF